MASDGRVGAPFDRLEADERGPVIPGDAPPPPADRLGGRATGEHAVVPLGDVGPAHATPGALRAQPARGGRPAGLRLYGVVSLDAEPPGGLAPMAAATELVAFRDVAAVVEPAPYAADPLAPPQLERYQAVVEEVFARRGIAPAPPGTVFRSAGALAGWLELHYYTLLEAVHFVEDRVVARVTAAWAGGGAAPARRAGPLRLGPEAPDDALPHDDLLAQVAEPFAALRREAVSLLVLRADDAGAPSAAYGSFLVERARWSHFAQSAAREAARHPALQLGVSGPWPPYDFVRMQFRG